MESTLTRNEKVFITMGLIFVVAFLVVFSKLNKKPTDLSHYATADAINYQMVRAEEGFAGYSLDGREVDERYEGLQTKKNTPAAKLLKPIAKSVAKPVVKSAAQNKKPNATQQNPTITTTVAVAAKLNSLKNKPEIKMAASNSVNPNVLVLNSNNIAANETAKPAQNEAAANKSKSKKTYAQWRQEIFGKASKDAVNDFITAYRRNEVTVTEYQAMAQDLSEQSDANLKGLGIMALRSQPSMESLSQLIRVQETSVAPFQAYIEQAYLAYVQPQNVQYLNQALQTQNRKLILKSLSLLSVNIPKIKSGDVSALVDSRHLRATDSNDLTLLAFKQLLPSLDLIGSAQVPEISPLAAQVATMIKSTEVAGL